MPKAFLGTWQYNHGLIEQTISAHGTITDRSTQNNKIIEDKRYKVLHVFSDDHALILMRSFYRGDPTWPEYKTWSKPMWTQIWIDSTKTKSIKKQTFTSGELCQIPIEGLWSNPLKHKAEFMEYYNNLPPSSSCLKYKGSQTPHWQTSSR